MTTIACTVPGGVVISAATEPVPLTLNGPPTPVNGYQLNGNGGVGQTVLTAAQKVVWTNWLNGHGDSPLLANGVIQVVVA